MTDNRPRPVALEHDECDPTCPRQIRHTFESCECGGARRVHDEYRRRLENRPTDTPIENRPDTYLDPEAAPGWDPSMCTDPHHTHHRGGRP